MLFATLVECLKAVDPEAKGRFTKTLDDAYAKIRNDSDNLHALELLNWTRTLVTGFSVSDGQGTPFFPGVGVD